MHPSAVHWLTNFLKPYMKTMSRNRIIKILLFIVSSAMIVKIVLSPTIDSLEAHTRAILVPRVSGTQGNVDVRKYIVDVLQSMNYIVTLDQFIDNTLVGQISFANIIASRNPNACKQLVFACHYDSKMMSNFLGATDSAVPCAILLRLAETFKNSFSSPNLGLQFIFFDGEEAFVEWTETDSLYGSRHLAAKWAEQPAPDHCQSTQVTRNGKQITIKSELDRIELFVLLDLVGASDTSFVSFHTQTRPHFRKLRSLERQELKKEFDGVERKAGFSDISFRNSFLPFAGVQDDHVPFQQRGVPILLLLSHPFPSVWHTVDDNYNAIDWNKTRRLTAVLEQFLATYATNFFQSDMTDTS